VEPKEKRKLLKKPPQDPADTDEKTYEKMAASSWWPRPFSRNARKERIPFTAKRADGVSGQKSQRKRGFGLRKEADRLFEK
jgi:hypothetical protein